MILVLSCNAAMMRTYEVQRFKVGQFHHASRFDVAAGAKGINVARVLRNLGQEVVVTGFAGGLIGRFIQSDLRKAGIGSDFVQIGEESRLCQTVIDRGRGTETRLDELGPLVSPREVGKLESLWRKLLPEAQIASISGNAARGVPVDLYKSLVEAAHEAGVPLVLDVHDELLREAVPAAPEVMKPNLNELEWLMQRQLSVPDGIVEASQELLAGGTQLVVTSLGSEGAIAVGAEGHWWAQPPKVEVVNTVGSGDAMVAGLISATVEGHNLPERLQWAVAAGTANATSLGIGRCTRAQVAELVNRTDLTLITSKQQNGSLGNGRDTNDP